MIQIEHWFGLVCFFLNEKYIQMELQNTNDSSTILASFNRYYVSPLEPSTCCNHANTVVL